MTKQLVTLLLGATALSACAVGPDYHAPAVTPVAAGAFQNTAPALVTTAAVQDHWWTLYQDPLLDTLVGDALAANTDIRVAVARIDKARAQLRGSRADRLPQSTVSAYSNGVRTSEAQTQTGADRENWVNDAGISLSYEIDLFGRVRRGVEASRGDYEAAQADADGVRNAVIADTVRAYLDATTSSERVAVAGQTVALLDKSIRITNARFEAGRSDRLDVIRVTALRDQQQAQIPSLLADRETALLRLATLTGRPPADLPAQVRAAAATPTLRDPIPVGDGAALIARRPDVHAAERRLAAESARIGVATADLYPRISLGGGIGGNAANTADILGGGPLRWVIGPLISWAFPNQEAIRARINGAKADNAAALATFDGTVLTALEDTERSLSVYSHAIERQQLLTSSRDEAARAARISLARQREGRADFLTVLDAQRTLAEAEANLVASRRAVAFAQVDLFRALGGGWKAS